jgi:hypothetical protein
VALKANAAPSWHVQPTTRTTTNPLLLLLLLLPHCQATVIELYDASHHDLSITSILLGLLCPALLQ